MRSLVVTNRGSGSVSIFDIAPHDVPNADDATPLRLRATFGGCPQATDVAILPDSSKAFIACSGGHQVMAAGLALPANIWATKHNSSLTADHFLAFLDVGLTPVHLAMMSGSRRDLVSTRVRLHRQMHWSQPDIEESQKMVGCQRRIMLRRPDIRRQRSLPPSLMPARAGDESLRRVRQDSDIRSLRTASEGGAKPQRRGIVSVRHVMRRDIEDRDASLPRFVTTSDRISGETRASPGCSPVRPRRSPSMVEIDHAHAVGARIGDIRAMSRTLDANEIRQAAHRNRRDNLILFRIDNGDRARCRG